MQQALVQHPLAHCEVMTPYDVLPVAVLAVNVAGEVLHANPAAVEMFGFIDEGMVGLSLNELLPQGARVGHQSWIRQYFESPARRRMGAGPHLQALRRNGEEFGCTVGLAPLDIGGQPCALATITETDRAALEAPDQDYNHWRQTLDQLGQHLWIWDVSDDSVHLSASWLRSMGYSPEEINCGSRWFALVHPDDLTRLSAAVSDCVDGRSDIFDLQFRLQHKQGHYRWLQSRAQVIERNAANTGCRLAGIYRDTTAIHAAEEALQTAEQRWKFALEGAGSGVWDWNVASGEVYFSPQWKRMLGFEADDLTPTIETWRELCHPEDLALSDAAIAAYIAGETAEYRTECRVTTADGKTKWILDRGMIVERDPAGQVLRMIGTHDDITEHKHSALRLADSARRLQTANDELEQFSYVASHDLKEPLRGISHLSQWIAEDLGDQAPGDVDKNLARLNLRVERMQNLIDDLAEYSRAGRERPALTAVSPAALAADIVAETDSRGCVIDIENVPAPMLTTSEVALRTVLRNLLVNAIVHHDNPHEGVITVSASAVADGLRFSVQDNGPGIEARHHERIFRIYQRLKPENHPEGSGSGLAIARRIVARLGSSISVESPLDGVRGTRMSFDWPADWDAAQQDPCPPDASL